MRNETFFKRQWKIAVMALLFIVLVASILYTTIPTIAYAKEVDFAENTIQRRIPTWLVWHKKKAEAFHKT